MKKRLGYLLYLIIALSLGVEVSLRCLGHQPGTFRKQSGFDEVDSLLVYDNFINDDFGVYRFSSWISDSIPTLYQRHDKSLREVQRDLTTVNWMDDIDYIWETAHCLTNEDNLNGCGLDEGEDWFTPFPALSDDIRSSSETLTPFDSLVLQYLERPFNTDGFRSISFRPVQSSRSKVLILGDSFAYGMTARPYFNSFSDRLLAMGYLVYNTGIPGVDPAQYGAIVDEYLKQLDPDVVIVNVYIGNDLMTFPRTPHPDQPHEHLTNAGFFTSSPLGTYLPPQEAYDYYLSLEKISTNSEKDFDRICSQSALLSAFWGIGYNLGYYDHPALDNYNKTHSAISETTRISNTAPHIKHIKAKCDHSRARLLFCVIPDRFNKTENQNGSYRTNPKLLKSLFSGAIYHEPLNILESDFYGTDDYHFNNKGHEKYAAFLDSLIRGTAPP